jgi:hypothetical protein
MNPYTACGFWPHRGEFAASVVDTEGRLHRAALPPDDAPDYWAFLSGLERLHGLSLQLVLPEPLLRGHPIAQLARARGMTVLVAPYRLAEAIAAVAYSRCNPHRLATVLARLPGTRFRGHLQLLPPRDPRQLQLL